MLKVVIFYRYLVLFVTTILLSFLSYDLIAIESEAEKYPADYFSANYQEARLKFFDSVQLKGGHSDSYKSKLAGPNNEHLSIDVAIFGPEKPTNILVLSSGTHGVEGFVGSAIQTGLLYDGVVESLGPDTGLVLIHAINPYGFTYIRRMNEDNVDLNRNFLDHSSPHPENLGYQELANSIAPESIDFLSNTKARLHFLFYKVWHDATALRSVISRGQYTHPFGLFYGGIKSAWSNNTIKTIAQRYLVNTKRVIVIDFHSGLGDYGAAEIIMNVPKESVDYLRATKCWGDYVKTTKNGESVSIDPHGTLKQAWPSMIPGAEVTAVSLEFGTLPPMEVFWALRAENWLHHHGKKGGGDSQLIKNNLLEAFYPSDAYWREQVWLKGRAIVFKTLECLKSVDYKRQQISGVN